MTDDPYVFGMICFLCGLISGILICIPAKRKGRYYYDK
jgi:hypothetical protein